MTSDYSPIDCDQHSVLEVLALRRASVRIDAVDEHGQPSNRTGQVIDVLTRDRAEFLRLQGEAGVVDLRLDRIREIFDASGAPLWRQKTDQTE